MGPTASGKTDLAIEIAKRQASDLISVDSALIYKDMNIGSAKPEPDVLARYPHALVDIRSPEESYSAASFANDAEKLIGQSIANKRLPVLVGGTMLYYRSLLSGLDDLPEADSGIRAELNRRLLAEGSAALHAALQQVDPVSAERLHPNDPQRISRALEVYQITGQPLSTLQLAQSREIPYRCLKIILLPKDRLFLHERIEKRFGMMLEQGFIDEVVKLREKYTLHPELPSMRSVGYRQAWQYLEGELNREMMIERGVIATRQLAKRQLTWLRKESDAQTFYIENDYVDSALALVDAFIKE